MSLSQFGTNVGEVGGWNGSIAIPLSRENWWRLTRLGSIAFFGPSGLLGLVRKPLAACNESSPEPPGSSDPYLAVLRRCPVEHRSQPGDSPRTMNHPRRRTIHVANYPCWNNWPTPEPSVRSARRVVCERPSLYRDYLDSPSSHLGRDS